MVIIFLRTAIILILLLVVMRLMGKRLIGEMQPYEFVITLLIAEVACVPMSDVSIPLLYGIASIVAIFIIHQILSLIEQSGQVFKRILSGKPSLVIDTEGVNFTELKKNNMDVEDLIESLRSTGNFSLEEIKYAILESNGSISVIKSDAPASQEIPLLIVNQGKILSTNLSKTGKNKQFLDDFIKKHGLNTLKEVAVMTADKKGKVYLQKKKGKFLIANFNEETSNA